MNKHFERQSKILVFSIFFLFGISFSATSEFYASPGITFHKMYDIQKESAPTPINLTLTFGGMLFSEKKVNLDFSGTFMMNYYDYTESGKTVYTEVENRTAIGYGLMLDFTVRYNKVIGNHRFTLGGGLGFLGTFATKAGSVPDAEKWKVDKISDSFWEPAGLFYPTLAVCWLYNSGNNFQTGLETKAHIGFKELKFSIAFKVAFGKTSRVFKTEEKSLEMESDSASVSSEGL